MCFRPSGVTEQITCPSCGKKINPVMGNVPKICPFCEAEISSAVPAASAPAGGAATPSTPGAPKPAGFPGKLDASSDS